MQTVQGNRFALDLTPAQQRSVLAHAGSARMANNWVLARVKAVWDQRAAERSYGVPEEALTPTMGWSGHIPRVAGPARRYRICGERQRRRDHDGATTDVSSGRFVR